MTKDAEAHADEDKRKREEIEARNQLDSMVYNADKQLKENREKVSAEDAKAIEDALADGRKALEGSDAAAMNAARDRLTTAFHKLAEAMYRQTRQTQAGGAAGGPAAGATPPPTGDGEGKTGEVIDAEYVDVDQEKK